MEIDNLCTCVIGEITGNQYHGFICPQYTNPNSVFNRPAKEVIEARKVSSSTQGRK